MAGVILLSLCHRHSIYKSVAVGIIPLSPVCIITLMLPMPNIWSQASQAQGEYKWHGAMVVRATITPHHATTPRYAMTIAQWVARFSTKKFLHLVH